MSVERELRKTSRALTYYRGQLDDLIKENERLKKENLVFKVFFLIASAVGVFFALG